VSSQARHFTELVELMRLLRSAKGCPWDRVQTHRSLKRCLIEETCEVIDSIDKKKSAQLMEELGDLLYLIIFYAQIAEEKGQFGLDDVMRQAHEKLTRRHPHVFGSTRIKGPAKVIEHWHRIKAQEARDQKRAVLANIPVTLPALHKAAKVQRKLAAAGFEERDTRQAWRGAARSWQCVQRLVSRGKKGKGVAAHIGGFLFDLVRLARQLDVDPEEALQGEVGAFVRNFNRLERAAGGRHGGNGRPIERIWGRK
jgi:tetrapyrrole methylase family protein / MazG family protein